MVEALIPGKVASRPMNRFQPPAAARRHHPLNEAVDVNGRQRSRPRNQHAMHVPITSTAGRMPS
jgi:hypothetical protein